MYCKVLQKIKLEVIILQGNHFISSLSYFSLIKLSHYLKSSKNAQMAINDIKGNIAESINFVICNAQLHYYI